MTILLVPGPPICVFNEEKHVPWNISSPVRGNGLRPRTRGDPLPPPSAGPGLWASRLSPSRQQADRPAARNLSCLPPLALRQWAPHTPVLLAGRPGGFHSWMSQGLSAHPASRHMARTPAGSTRPPLPDDGLSFQEAGCLPRRWGHVQQSCVPGRADLGLPPGCGNTRLAFLISLSPSESLHKGF